MKTLSFGKGRKKNNKKGSSFSYAKHNIFVIKFVVDKVEQNKTILKA